MLTRYNVYGVSDWPETMGQRFNIFTAKPFASEADAIAAARAAFDSDLEIIVEPSGPLLVILESPFAGDEARNIAYGRRCLHDSLMRAEAPIASHLLYTQPGVLDDSIPEERTMGIEAGLAWRAVAQASVVYVDYGISKGMQYGIDAARAAGLRVEERTIGPNPE